MQRFASTKKGHTIEGQHKHGLYSSRVNECL